MTRVHVRGVAAIELALILLGMVFLTVGVVEVGRALHAYDTLAKQVRGAARYYITTLQPDVALKTTATKNMAVFGNPAGTGSPALPGLTTSMVTVLEPTLNAGVNEVTAVATGAGSINLVSVSINGYPMSSMTATVFPDITFGPISVTMPFVFF